jgi:hypothetical protein
MAAPSNLRVTNIYEPERGQPASPEAELQERQYFELQLKIHVLILTDIELFCVLNNIYGYFGWILSFMRWMLLLTAAEI